MAHNHLNAEIGGGAEKLLALAQKTSKKDAPLAVAQLLTAAVALCGNEETFREGAEIAIRERWGQH